MTTVFISHTSSDDAFVARIAQRLASAGVETWIDNGRIVPGDDIIQKVETGLSDATHVIVVFSPASLLSDWVREETHAAQLTAISGSSRVIPIIYGAISPSAIPLLLRSRLYVDFREPKNFEQSMAQLLSAFAPSTEPPASKPSLEIIDCQFARRPKDGAIAIELLLTNHSKRIVNIKNVSISSGIPYHVSYWHLPPTVAFPLSLTVGPRTANGQIVVGGFIGHEAEEWRRPVIGQLALAPYHTELIINLPIYVAVGPQEEVLLRIPFESITTGMEQQIEIRRLLGEERFEHYHGSGTRIQIDASNAKASFVAQESLLETLLPLIPDHDNHEIQSRFRRS